jgi:hypothetical protein
MTSSGFVIGQTYTRPEIAAQLGGDWQSYLPHKNGRVVCGCFTADMNPDVPVKVLVGNGPQVLKAAEMLDAQIEPVPVFLKQEINCWEYVGEYAGEFLTDPQIVTPLARRAGRSDVVGVLLLTATAGDAQGYDEARDRQLRVMQEGLDLHSSGQIDWTRDDLHRR